MVFFFIPLSIFAKITFMNKNDSKQAAKSLRTMIALGIIVKHFYLVLIVGLLGLIGFLFVFNSSAFERILGATSLSIALIIIIVFVIIINVKTKRMLKQLNAHGSESMFTNMSLGQDIIDHQDTNDTDIIDHDVIDHQD